MNTEKEHKSINKIKELLSGFSTGKDTENIINNLGEDLEKKINGKNEKFFDFLSETAEIILKETGAGFNAAVAGLLFLTDKDFAADIEKRYNKTVFKIYEGLRKIPEIKSEKTEKQEDNFIKLLLNLTGDVRAVLVLVAVQVFKMRNINSFSENEKKEILKLSKNIYIPLTHRTGLYNIKTELEEIRMKHTETEMYRFIAGKLHETKASRDKYIKNFIEPLKKLLEDAGYHFTIKGRPKSIHSIWNKMKTKQVSFEEVYDLFAIRIILKSDLKNEKTVCWNVYSLITNVYKPNPKRLRDWISAPKLSGYESLHTTVLGPENKWVEVQIRTERMDEIAEKGPASHFSYKAGTAGKGTDWLSKIREAIENPEEDREEDDKIKSSLYSDDILVFTPDNDLKSLKKGYTVLDFAFSVHSKIGETCTGAIVNGKIKPLSYELQNGDTVKILTNKKQKPNPEWLETAKSPRTKNKIKRALKAVTYDAAEIGKDLLKEKIERLKIEFNDITVQKTAYFFNCKTVLELFHKIGKGTIDLQKIKSVFEEKDNKKIEEEKSAVSEKVFEQNEDIFSGNDDYLIIEDNLSGLDFKFAKCCNPLPGDEIFGFVTVNRGTKIHKTSCPNAKEMFAKFPYRTIKAKWNKIDGNSAFSASIYIYGTDKTGLANEISRIITEEFNLKMQAISLKTKPGNMFEGVTAVLVNNRKQLNDLIRRLKMIKGINLVKEKNSY